MGLSVYKFILLLGVLESISRWIRCGLCVCVCIFIVRDDALPWDTLVFPETRTLSYITTT